MGTEPLAGPSAGRYEGGVRFGAVLGWAPWVSALLSCGSVAAPSGVAVPSSTELAATPRHAAPRLARPGAFTGGSSDGTTCEQAREQYTEEINLETGAQTDLRADDFAAILNNGTYLGACEVPTESRVRICAAVQNGKAVGVTVLLDPSAPTIEVCVAGQVRQLAFPSNGKMDFVNVAF